MNIKDKIIKAGIRLPVSIKLDLRLYLWGKITILFISVPDEIDK